MGCDEHQRSLRMREHVVRFVAADSNPGFTECQWRLRACLRGRLRVGGW